MKKAIRFLILCAGLGAAAPSPAAEPAAPWTDPRAIRDAARAIESEPVSDIRAFLDRCRTELPGPAGSFDPHYDPDVERELRRRDAQAARKGRDAADAYVPWAEVSKWSPTNDLQLALRELSLATARRIRRLSAGDADTGLLAVERLGAGPAFGRSVKEDLFCLMAADAWKAGMGEMDRVVAGHKRFLGSVRDASEQRALAARMVRRAAALKSDWKRYRDVRGATPWIETSRRQLVHDCGIVSAETERCLVTWMRIAALVRNYGRLAEETKDILVETNRVLDEHGKTIRSDKEPYYAGVFASMQQLLALDFFNHGVLGMEGEPFEVIEPFAKESARLLGIQEGEGYKEYLRGVDGMVSLVKDNPDAILAFLEREDARNGVVRKPPKIETPVPDPGRFEPYPVSDELKKELDRYGLEAGSFVQAAFRQPGKTNRVSYVVRAPKNASGPVPVLLFLPGVGEIGKDLAKLFRQRTIFDVATSDDFQRKHPCYLVAISPPDGTGTLSGYDSDGGPTPMQRTIHDALVGIIHTQKRPAADEDRIYATGLSFGGTGAYALSFAYPGFFAACAPVSGLIFPAKRLGDALPCHYHHLYNEGELKSCPEDVAMLEEFGARVRELGGDFRAVAYPDAGHNAWDAAWRDESVWDWLFSKRRATRSPRNEPHAESAEPKPHAEGAEPAP